MTKTAGVYGGALYDLAREEGKTEEILQQLHTVNDLFKEEPQFVYLLATPSLPKAGALRGAGYLSAGSN